MKKLFLVFLGLTMLLVPVSAQALSIGMWGEWATIGQQFNDSLSGYFGYSIYYGVTDYLVKADLNLAKLGNVQTKMGLYYETDQPNDYSTVGLTYGMSTMVQPNLSVGGDISILNSENYAGATTTNVFPITRVAVNLYF
ncbi:MAG: hypothetical protein NT099_07685 [Candidatus Saganbacteria bacterium]|nr:hypothetical protein [Candidatus Saganbacteria bacterium]